MDFKLFYKLLAIGEPDVARIKTIIDFSTKWKSRQKYDNRTDTDAVKRDNKMATNMADSGTNLVSRPAVWYCRCC
jgi:hypothetical protein